MMRRRVGLLLAVGLAILLASTGVVLAQSTTPTNKQKSTQPSTGQGQPPAPGSNARVCPGPAGPGHALCHAVRHDVGSKSSTTNGGATPTTGSSSTKETTTGGSTTNGGATPAVTPSGYGPADLASAYNLAGASGTGTVAIVDAFDDPTAESDLGVYRAQFGLPTCTTANGCFTKVNQTGGTSYPNTNSGWAQEISLDVDMVSAVCPNCKILLVEASDNSFTNLATAVDYAAKQTGVAAISNSYGGSEYSGEVSDQSHYNHPGMAITVSSGDNGYGVEFPAASQYVTAVGGTHLTRASNTRGWSETVWSGAGSGCSAYISKPSWQTDGGCSKRTVADVSADADPNTGVAVYDSTPNNGTSGWLVFGGTSVASPIIASIYTLAGNTSSLNYGSSSYNNPSSLYDTISGSNGSCGGSYLCTGGQGYDGPTGNGTPNSTTGFSSTGGTPPPPTSTIPTAPSSLTATRAGNRSNQSINLNWADNSNNEDHFVVERSIDQTFSSGVASTTLAANTTSYTDKSVSRGTTYYYRVKATNSAGSSSYSNTASASTK